MNSPTATPQFFPDPPESKYTFERSLRKYFLFNPKRWPKIRYAPKPQPPDPDGQPEEFDKFIAEKRYGFVTRLMLAKAGVPAGSVVYEDVKVLNRVLVRPFIDEDFNAGFWQNQYFLFQWLFALFALFATIFAVLATATAVASATAASLTTTLPANALPGIFNYKLAGFFGTLTTIMAVIVTILVSAYNRDRPQRTWYEKRRNAESLRKQYYLYLMHMPPYDNQRHAFALQMIVARIQHSGEQKPDIRADTPPRAPAHTDADSAALLTLYNDLRVQEQMVYYKQRSREYDFNADVTFSLTLAVPLAVTLIAGFNIAYTNPFVALVIVIMPSIGALFATFQRVYDWEKQQTLYQKTFEGLQEAKIIDYADKKPPEILRALVDAVENELAKESDQWGAALNEIATEISAEQIIDAFKKKTSATEDEVRQLRQQLGLK